MVWVVIAEASHDDDERDWHVKKRYTRRKAMVVFQLYINRGYWVTIQFEPSDL